MNNDLLDKLKELTEEEVAIKSGNQIVNKDLYMSSSKKNEIDSNKLLDRGKLITVRPHTRFIDFPEHTHNYIELAYMYEGQTTHIINGQEIVLHKGDLLFLSRCARQAIKKADENDICINFIILPEFFDTTLEMLGEENNLLREFIVNNLTNKDSEVPFLHFKVANVLPIQNLVENLIWTLTNKQQNKRHINKITMGLLFLQLLNHIDKAQTLTSDILLRTYEYIEENYKDGELSDLALKLNYDLAWLSRKIKKLSGQTYTELLHTKRLNQAVFLLTETKLSVYDIGYAVGYNNISYFYRIFKNKYGVSPKEYRKKDFD